MKIGKFNLNIGKWPRNCVAALSLDIDDVYPESDKEGLDHSGDMDYGKFNYVSSLSQKLGLKYTLFVTPDWLQRYYKSKLLRLMVKILRRPENYSLGKFRIDNEKYAKWRKWLMEKISTNRFEVAIHGLYHFNLHSKYKSQEFIGLSESECYKRLDLAEKIFEKARVPYVRGFRPPGWGISKELLEALRKKGYLFLAGSADTKTPISSSAKSRGAGLKGVSLIYPDHYGNYPFLTLTANCDHKSLKRALEIARLGGLILIHTHIAPTGVSAVSEEYYKGIFNLLTSLKSRYDGNIWCATLGEVAEWWLALEKIKILPKSYSTNEIILRINNPNPYVIEGLTFNVTNSKGEKVPYDVVDAENMTQISILSKGMSIIKLRVKE